MDDILTQDMKGFRLLCWALSLPAGIALDSKQSHLHIAWLCVFPLLPRKLGFRPCTPCRRLPLF